MLIRFVRVYLPYAPGDVAWFDERLAGELVRRGIAVPCQESAPLSVEDTVVDAPPVDRMVRRKKK